MGIQDKVDWVMKKLSRKKREKAAKDERLYATNERSLFTDFKKLPLDKQHKLAENNRLLASFMEREGGQPHDRL